MSVNNLEVLIKKFATEKRVSIRQLCQKIGMTESGFSRSLKNNVLKVETLQKVADELGISICEFFDSENKDSSEQVNKLKRQILLLRSFVNIAAADGKGLISLRYQEEIETWNLSWAELKHPIDKKAFEDVAKEINKELYNSGN